MIATNRMETEMTQLELFQISGSPNNVKARIALGYKRLAYSKWDLPMNEGEFPFDRSRGSSRSRASRARRCSSMARR